MLLNTAMLVGNNKLGTAILRYSTGSRQRFASKLLLDTNRIVDAARRSATLADSSTLLGFSTPTT